jgi:hypothetical protein
MSTAPILTTGDMSRKKFYNQDFSGKDFSHKKMRSSFFYRCTFDNTDMSHADAEGSEFVGCSFVDTTCYYTNFKDAKLAGNTFKPKDCYGMAVTMSCKTFDGMETRQLWWYGMLMFATMMVPDQEPVNEDLNAKLIALIGAERYVKLRSMFQKREI